MTRRIGLKWRVAAWIKMVMANHAHFRACQRNPLITNNQFMKLPKLRYTVFLLLSIGLVLASQNSSVADRPNYQLLSFNEDWSTISAQPKKDLLDQIKYIPLSGNDTVWASFGGHLSERVESWSNFAFGAPTNNDDSFLFHGDLYLGKISVSSASLSIPRHQTAI